MSIEIRLGVADGVACIAKSRIPIWLLESFYLQGANDVDLLNAYPSLRAEDLANARAYARAHMDEITRLIAENEA
ncbi:DUF433 domain-containing protein [Spirosoma endophyticum]|uniref:Uncharacterized conserved protein, DUF433 family n=1 Tax=Spirosoma endophyticum TaxID=662367 RepID=A0A1I1M7L5_9BACT|nr:DUF433 domain-containing protein [Spirosoma endophyticum]SFC81507.1 Uncharacterized conserved protein, DUF433 family [Spirosoma endophyticum]